MAVAYVGSTTAQWGGAGTSFTHNSGSPSDGLLLVCAASNSWNVLPVSVTYAGIALTLASSSHDSLGPNGRPVTISVWYLVGPASGSNSVTIVTAEKDYCGIAATYSGVFATTPIIASSISASTGENDVWSDSSVPSDSAGLCIAFCAAHNDESILVDAGQTERNEIRTASFGGNNVQANLSDEPGTGSPIGMGADVGNSNTDSIVYITFGLQPPQNVSFDASVNPAVAASGIAVGSVDDGNISLSNLAVLAAAFSITVANVTIEPPLEADILMRAN